MRDHVVNLVAYTPLVPFFRYDFRCNVDTHVTLLEFATEFAPVPPTTSLSLMTWGSWRAVLDKIIEAALVEEKKSRV